MKNAPCYKCDKRHEACHADCAEYSAWAKAHAEQKGKGKRESAGGHEADTFLIEKHIRMKKRMGGAK